MIQRKLNDKYKSKKITVLLIKRIKCCILAMNTCELLYNFRIFIIL